MKSFSKKFILPIFVLLSVFGIAACSRNPSAGGSSGGGTAIYEVAVDTTHVTADISGLKVCIYALDGDEGSREAQLIGSKATFSLKSGNYVATLSGIDETVSFSSVLLTESSKKATITLDDSDYDAFRDKYIFTLTVALCSSEKSFDEISAQICDNSMCIPIVFDKNGTADIRLYGGEYSVEVFDSDSKEIYRDQCAITADVRYYIIRL